MSGRHYIIAGSYTLVALLLIASCANIPTQTSGADVSKEIIGSQCLPPIDTLIAAREEGYQVLTGAEVQPEFLRDCPTCLWLSRLATYQSVSEETVTVEQVALLPVESSELLCPRLRLRFAMDKKK